MDITYNNVHVFTLEHYLSVPQLPQQQVRPFYLGSLPQHFFLREVLKTTNILCRPSIADNRSYYFPKTNSY